MTQLTCSETEIVTTHRIMSADLNEHGTLFGGRLLSIVDAEASIAALRVAKQTVVTATIDHVNFQQPFHLGDAMEMHATVVHLGQRSIEVFVKVLRENLTAGQRELAFTACLLYVVADHNFVMPVDEIIPETASQRYLVATAAQRQQARQLMRATNLELSKHI